MRFLFITLCLLLSLTLNSFAQEYIIEPPPYPPQEKNYFVIDYERVNIKIKDQAAAVTIEQLLKNQSSSDIEATLIFPIPEDAGISDFSMFINDKEVKGKIMDKDEASKIYEEIVRKLKDPGLLEYSGTGLFRARIYPIPANGKTKIIIKYSQLLKGDSGVVKYKLPLLGKTSEWPLKELTIGVDLTSSIPIKSFYSPTHSMDIKKDGDKHIKASFEDTSYEGKDDLLLYYNYSKEDFGLSLLTYREDKNEPGFFLLIASPGEELKKEEILPKDVVFVLDTSGSMDDDNKLVYAKKTLAFCLGHLNMEDRFNIISFSSDTDLFSEKLSKPSEISAKKAKDFIDKLEPLGGTNIDEAIKTALKQFSDDTRPHYIVFLTDGLPTQGETDMNTILKDISSANKTEARIFSFGVGNDVNTLLLDLMAEKNRGYTSYLEPGEEIEIAVSSFFTKISYPVLSNINLDFGTIKVKDIFPKQLPDMFKGSQLLAFGRYVDGGHSAITLSGLVNGKKKNYTFEKTFSEKDNDNTFIPVLWATRKIGYLLNEIRLHGENDETVNEIVKLAKRYGIVTPYTSFLIKEEINRTEGEAPVPVDEEKLYSTLPYTYKPSQSNMDNTSGAPSIETSGKLNKYQEAETVNVAEEVYSDKQVASSVKTVADKTFYLKNGIWVDSIYTENLSKTEIEFAGDKYFALVKSNPQIGKYLAAGDELILLFNGKCYHIFKK